MESQNKILFKARPSLRRAIFFSAVYAGLVLYGRIVTDLNPDYNRIWWGNFITLVCVFLFVLLKRWTTTYLITDTEIQNLSGIFARKFTIIPHQRITNATAQQTFLERLLGLASINFDSAGGDKSELSFIRITKAEAHRAASLVRDIRNKKHGNPDDQDH